MEFLLSSHSSKHWIIWLPCLSTTGLTSLVWQWQFHTFLGFLKAFEMIWRKQTPTNQVQKRWISHPKYYTIWGINKNNLNTLGQVLKILNQNWVTKLHMLSDVCFSIFAQLFGPHQEKCQSTSQQTEDQQRDQGLRQAKLRSWERVRRSDHVRPAASWRLPAKTIYGSQEISNMSCCLKISKKASNMSSSRGQTTLCYMCELVDLKSQENAGLATETSQITFERHPNDFSCVACSHPEAPPSARRRNLERD